MILPRDIYNGTPPERRTRASNNPTLLYSWWCTIFSIVIIGFRLSGRYIRNERLFREDKIMAWSIIPLLARMGCIHVVLIYGTNNVDVSSLTDPVKIRRREIGSRCVLAARIFYAMFIWMAKFTVSEFLKRLTERFWKKGYEWGLRGIRIFLVATFLMVLIATLAECRPNFSHYWQVVPDPGPQCRQGYAQLLTMGVTDIVTDVLLVAFPIPIIFRSAMPLKRKVSLTALFSMSIILIVVTGARMPLVIHRKGIQQFRTVFASSEIFAAAIVSNAIILGSFLRDRGVKKAKFKAGSTTDSMERRGSARRYTNQPCSSDEDLARSLGYRTKPELTEKPSTLPRPAPVANLDLLSSKRHDGPFANNNWQFPQQELGIFQSNSDKLSAADVQDPLPSPRAGRRVSWVDAGGLLENAAIAPSPTDSVIAHDFAPQPRRNSRATNTVLPNGRSYPPPARRPSRLSQQSEDYESSTRAGHQLQDLGGLLSEEHEKEGKDHSPNTPPSRPSTAAIRQQRRQSMSTHRVSSQSSRDVPSLQDPGDLLSSHTSAPIRRTQTQTSYDVPSLKDAGGLLSSASQSPNTSPHIA
ncbi:hypothetical protein CC86DRAFT_378735 [Ophiobolus disseminans]|uniref:Rhodopsin domain-containing protein n=1 Tax=Ophiobolus disseminans TaxID=1469910 RepID=A0A6A7ACK1_9PLEO|nr:hypothetical protein CC86DRAFT_378735 [Ophiobolus disseminans]